MSSIERALVSVSNKEGVVEFARELAALGVEIVSTGGTAATLAQAGVPVRQVWELTGFPEMMDGRVKTLHPKIHGGILFRRDLPEHRDAAAQHAIAPIDLVCVNLYPFAQTVAKPGVSLEEAVENIDIGGPAMVRSAAKNHDAVTVVVDPADYGTVLEEMKAHSGSTTLELRRRLAAKAFAHTARYDALIATYLNRRFDPENLFPQELALGYSKVQDCRYGENPHQRAAFYAEAFCTEPSIGTARQIHGKELSFNNIYDLNAALETVKELPEKPAAVIIKHTNPCGAAQADTLAEAFRLARRGDPVSAFGGILAVNRPVDVDTAEEITGKNTFFEAVIAPGFHAEALPILTGKKKWGANLRLLEVGDLPASAPEFPGLDLKKVVGGLLVQERDLKLVTARKLVVVTRRPPTPEEEEELLFAWRIVKHVKSNAIVLTRERQVVGVGAGQMNRVQSVRLAVGQAGERARGAVMASDAFFPFPDGPEVAAEAGVTAVIQPGGSVKDQDTIEVCDRYNIAMVFTDTRHFLH
ncbi:MAG: bifunctional phosphoribosylaminoimidazolecarboxamide formyltransferase/IMP cyclohydrolase [Chthonomonadales bacterium]